MGTLRVLQVGAAVEAVTLLVLVVNRLTVHLDPVTSLTGPLHGSAYLVVIGATLLLPDAPRAAKLLALVPGIGGWLALRRVTRARLSSATPDPAGPAGPG